jgi:hypothetical protein
MNARLRWLAAFALAVGMFVAGVLFHRGGWLRLLARDDPPGSIQAVAQNQVPRPSLPRPSFQG